MTHDELEVYEKMNWETPSDELADAVENLVRQVKRLREQGTVALEVDTDRYEGHTPGPWKLHEGDPYDDEACWMNIVSENAGPRYGFAIQECVGFSDVPEGTPDVRLMVDAPLLATEVKRLRLLSMAYESYIAHHVVVEYRQCPECGSLDFTSKFDDEGIECKCDKCDNKWKVKIE